MLETNGPLDGITQLSLTRLVVVDDRELVTQGGAFAEVRWPIRRSLDVECVDGALVETEAVGGPYLDVDWSAPTSLSVTSELAFEPGTFVAERSVVASDRVELVQRGSIALDPAGCARFSAAFDGDVDCTVSGIVRQALRPVDDVSFVPRTDDAAFVFATEGGNVTRFADAPVFYLPADAPGGLDELAQPVVAAIAAVVPGFEIRPNDCSEAAVAAAPFELPVGTLVERCAAYERLAPDDFTWQKPGGFASTVVWRAIGAPLGWGTFASRAVDADSGRVVAADVIIDATALDQIASRVRRNAGDPNLRALVARAEARRDEVASITTSGARVLEEGARPRPLDVLVDMLAVTQLLTTFDLTEDVAFAAVHAGPQVGATLPRESAVYRRLPARILASVVDGRSEAAEVMGRGYSFLPRWSHPGHGATSALLAMNPDVHAELVTTGVARHRLLHAMLEALGLRDNPAGSWDGDTSVMDVVVAERQHAAVELGVYDVAALANLYANGPRADGLVRCDSASAMTAPTLSCAIDDHGTTARASFAHAYGRWLGHYPITHVVDDSLGYVPNPHDVLRPVVDAFWRASIAGQEASYRYESDVDFARSAHAIDLTSTVLHATNLASEIIATPLPGRHCPWPGVEEIYLPSVFFRENCDADLPLDSAGAIAQRQIDVRLGVGRDTILGPEAGPGWTRVGARIDKTTVLWAIALGFPNGLDPSVPRVGLVDVEPSLAQLYGRIVEEPPFYASTTNALNLGSYWCEGDVVGRRALDVDVGLGPATPPAGCTAYLHPMLGGSVVPSSILFKQTVPAARPMLIFQVGVDDESIDWDAIAPGGYCYLAVDGGDEWRAIRADDPVACALLDHAEAAKVDYESSGNDVYRRIYELYRDYVRSAHRLRSYRTTN